jgi:hypothetical protein
MAIEDINKLITTHKRARLAAYSERFLEGLLSLMTRNSSQCPPQELPRLIIVHQPPHPARQTPTIVATDYQIEAVQRTMAASSYQVEAVETRATPPHTALPALTQAEEQRLGVIAYLGAVSGTPVHVNGINIVEVYYPKKKG